MKIILYGTFGGFHLSDEMVDLYEEKTGIVLDNYSYDYDRTDPILIQVIKENDPEDNFRVWDIPKGTEYIIDQYDGKESLVFKDDVIWQVAT